ncbi:MAG: twin-arginine translocase TatA/TatE family subunit [Candidatus Fermentibacteraceae bacterium]|nr:twin-arginine translocase TatA/TatE family subunit [Candidatus Fermentibacteraceae bacterium]
MGRIGTTELVLILVVLLLLFGAKRIPDIARAVGKSMSQFKKGLKDIDIKSDETSREDENKEQSEE